jgi:hypothetical protein
MLYSCCSHTVFILYSYCTHAVPFRPLLQQLRYCTHAVLMMYSYCTHTVPLRSLLQQLRYCTLVVGGVWGVGGGGCLISCTTPLTTATTQVLYSSLHSSLQTLDTHPFTHPLHASLHAEDAAGFGITAGCDQEGGGTGATGHLPDAIKHGKATESMVNEAFRRNFRVRIQLGMLGETMLSVRYV